MPTLYLIRHGLAADRDRDENDADRPLTPSGLQKTGQVALRLVACGLTCDRLLTSPLIRAQQTAQILVDAGFAADMQVLPALAPAGSLPDWLAWLRSASGLTAIALVGHEPDLSTWAETLLWGAPRGNLLLKKAGIIGLTLPEQDDPVGHSSLFWLTPPRLFIS
jgi:phosphohistidine phosphatase